MVWTSPGKRDFLRLAKLMDANEVVAGYLQALERDAHRLAVIERRLSRIEKMLVLLGKAVSLDVFNTPPSKLTGSKLSKAIDNLADSAREVEGNPYVPQQNT